jgi:pimeloyl-ACP methyl ester carboxylesterase
MATCWLKHDTSILFGPDGLTGGTILLTFEVPIEYLKFPHRTPGAVSSEVQNGVPNVVTIIPNAAVFSTSLGVLRCGAEERSPNFFAASIEFDAMAPIVLVHGWNAGPWVWGPPKPANPTDPCRTSKTPKSKGGQNFVQAFIAAKAPYDCSFQTPAQASIDKGAQDLQALLPGILASFGTRHVNLVTHSKGGLFAREFLQLNADQDPATQIGVISLTTLEAPHHGSVLADTVVASRQDPSVLQKLTQYTPFYYIVQKSGFFRAGNNDMTVGKVHDFNEQYKVPPEYFKLAYPANPQDLFFTRPQYYATSADADLDSDGTISATEAAPPSFPVFDTYIANWRYQRLRTVRSIKLVSQGGGLQLAVQDPAPYGTFYLNDLAVTTDSATYDTFTQIGPFLGPFVGASGRNHSTIRMPDIAQTVLLNIRAAEKKQ